MVIKGGFDQVREVNIIHITCIIYASNDAERVHDIPATTAAWYTYIQIRVVLTTVKDIDAANAAALAATSNEIMMMQEKEEGAAGGGPAQKKQKTNVDTSQRDQVCYDAFRRYVCRSHLHTP